MTSIEQAKQQIQEQRQLVERQRVKIEGAKEHYKKEEAKIPKPTQRLLRSGMYSGLEGRKRRQIVSKIKEGITRQKAGLEKGEKYLTEYIKGTIEPFEAEVGQLQKQESAKRLLVEIINKRYGGVPTIYEEKIIRSAFLEAGLNPDEGAQIYKDELRNILWQYESAIEKLQEKEELKLEQVSTPFSFGVKPIYSPSGQLVGVDDPIKKISRLPTLKEKSLFSIKNDFSIDFATPRNLPPTDIIKDIRPLMSIDLQKSSVSNIFRTTGSPVRMTKLTSPKSRGYIPSIKHKVKKTLPQIKSQIKKVKIKKKTKKKILFDSDEDFLFSKQKKKKNIWGI